jgi:glutamate/aspartate transport system substrate-binding protein
MLPKGDAALKAVVDRTIARLETNGRGQSLYNARFMSPIVVLT